jgi:hypothetical protein
MTKITLVLATIATLGLSGAAFADVARPTVKHQVRITHVQPVTPKKLTVHWIGTKRYVLVRGHKVWLSPQAQYVGKKHFASHVKPVTPKKLTVHWTGTKRYVLARGHKVWLSSQAQYAGKKHVASHATVSKLKRTKVAS